MRKTKLRVEPGRSQPLGATPDRDGVNFSLYSEHATSVDLLLFDSDRAPTPSRTIPLEHKSFHFWHCYVRGLRPGQIYAYRVDGPADPARNGTRFNPSKVLIDPYARGNVNTLWDRGLAVGTEDNVATSMRSVVIDTQHYDWEGDTPLGVPLADTIIYEMHVRGFTRSDTSGCAYPGTFSAVIEKIPYLKSLGITAVELLPVFDFDEQEVLRYGPDGQPLRNHWGYDPFGFFAPHSDYCQTPDAGTHVTEFRDMVKALHREGIEVILDVVFNHTTEGDERGPTVSFRGQCNELFYHLWPADRSYYMNYSGCGNAINANHPMTAKFIIECLEYWVTEHHVDGFRFDLGSELSRGIDGAEMESPPVLWGIELSRALADTKIIAEPWDAAGLYQVGRFPGKRWAEWNGPFRDHVRRFVRGDAGLVGEIASRIGGSADLFGPQGLLPTNSINFITAHDGFTLNDLVSYNGKHNEANGENNQDGSDDNNSWNCGVEGPTDDEAIEALRRQQIKNLFAILMLSRGVPMILSGDEVRRTQGGNNNTYCQDNETTWFDWALVDKNTEILSFFRRMVEFRRRMSVLRSPEFLSDAPNERGLPGVTWHGTRLNSPGWGDPGAHALAYTMAGMGDEPDLHVILNMFHLELDFEIPTLPGRRWRRAVDTSLPGPDDITAPGEGITMDADVYRAAGRSVVVLLSEPTQGTETTRSEES
ncbi:glycogen debranching protein GlgX [Streptosporangium sp. NPDC000396]|uniref:glycogen debranching protein GlgX n=1 Tax=Streptosporangium sp. NPDC000396 TaxID=3366185 RepID=UPI003688B1EB